MRQSGAVRRGFRWTIVRTWPAFKHLRECGSNINIEQEQQHSCDTKLLSSWKAAYYCNKSACSWATVAPTSSTTTTTPPVAEIDHDAAAAIQFLYATAQNRAGSSWARLHAASQQSGPGIGVKKNSDIISDGYAVVEGVHVSTVTMLRGWASIGHIYVCISIQLIGCHGGAQEASTVPG